MTVVEATFEQSTSEVEAEVLGTWLSEVLVEIEAGGDGCLVIVVTGRELSLLGVADTSVVWLLLEDEIVSLQMVLVKSDAVIAGFSLASERLTT